MRKEIIDQLYKLCTNTSSSSSEIIKFESFLEIWQLVEKLIEVEKDIKDAASERTDEDFDKFIDYLKQNGCNTDSFEVKKSSIVLDEYGLKSRKSFEKGDLIVNIPKSVILTSADALNSSLGSIIKNDKLLSAMPNVSLSLFLLHEKLQLNNNSKWSTYLNTLPKTFHNVLYFNLDEIKLLQVSQSFNFVLMHIRNIVRQYAYIYKLLQSQSNTELHHLKENFSFNNYRWSTSVVSTRQNKIIDECNNQLYALIPVLDMCNHEDGEMCTEYDPEVSTANCYAMKNVHVGDEITIFYGQRNNRDFLIHNGFVTEQNSYDSTYLRLGISPNDKLFKDRLSVLLKFGMANSELFELAARNSQIVPLNAYVYAKIFSIKTAEELRDIFASDLTVNKYSTENNVVNDSNVKQFLKIRFSILMQSYQKLNIETNEIYNYNMNTQYIKRLLLSELMILKRAHDFLA